MWQGKLNGIHSEAYRVSSYSVMHIQSELENAGLFVLFEDFGKAGWQDA